MRYRSALSAKSAKGLAALPLFGAARATRKQSITSGDSRFTMLLMQQLADDAPLSHDSSTNALIRRYRASSS